MNLVLNGHAPVFLAGNMGSAPKGCIHLRVSLCSPGLLSSACTAEDWGRLSSLRQVLVSSVSSLEKVMSERLGIKTQKSVSQEGF